MTDRRICPPGRFLALTFVLTLGAALVPGRAWAQAAGANADNEAALIAEYGFAPDQVGFFVFDVASGRRLTAHRSETPFILASVAKVPTTVMALEVLGPGHRFETLLAATGTAADGTLKGNLYLVGGGDPLLDPADLVRFADSLESRGINRVAGKFYYDASRLVGGAAIEPSQPEDAGYNPAYGALSLAFNRLRLRWQRKKGSGALSVEASADSDRMEVPMRNVTVEPLAEKPAGAKRWQAFIYAGQTEGPLGGPRWQVSPRLADRGSAWLPVKRPGIFAARVFRNLAASRGVALPPPAPAAAPGQAPDGVWAVHRQQSLPLAEIVLRVLKFSNNLAAELIGLEATLQLSGQALDLAGSGARTATWFRERLPESDWNGFELANHSGLSIESRASPAQLAAIIRFALDREYGARRYRELLPLKIRKPKSKPGRTLLLRAKSGTIDYVRSRAGTMWSKGGPRLGFALFIADAAARRPGSPSFNADDPDRRSPRARARAQSWLRRARALEWALLQRWAAQFGANPGKR